MTHRVLCGALNIPIYNQVQQRLDLGEARFLSNRIYTSARLKIQIIILLRECHLDDFPSTVEVRMTH